MRVKKRTVFKNIKGIYTFKESRNYGKVAGCKVGRITRSSIKQRKNKMVKGDNKGNARGE